MSDITDRLNMTDEMAAALEAEEATKSAKDKAAKMVESNRQKDLYDDAMEKMKAKYWETHKTQPRGMTGIESIPEESAREFNLDDLLKKEARSSAIRSKLGKLGRGAARGLGAAAGLGLGMALEQETGPEEGSLSAMIEDPKLPEDIRKSAHERLRKESGAEEEAYFEELRQKKLERALAAEEGAREYEPEMPDYPMEFTSGDPRTEEAKAYESKAARRKEILNKIRRGEY